MDVDTWYDYSTKYVQTEGFHMEIPAQVDDAAAARMTGVSRSRIAELVEQGQVFLNGAPVSKSTRVAAGDLLEVEIPAPRQATVVPQEVAGIRIVHDDADIVVVDKPSGVAAHPSVGWEGPTVLGALAAAGYRIATTGAAERQGVVHRLDVGTSGLMVVAKSERAYTALKRAFKERVAATPGEYRNINATSNVTPRRAISFKT